MTRRVFAQIRETHPKKLFIAADGPRADRPEEAKLCAEAHAVVDGVDWPCEVKTLFQERNLGCRQGPISAITWFFEHVEEGIILEDDCLPDPSFFPFCAELLERYRDDKRVFIVSGLNSLGEWKANRHSYFFTLGDNTGWATWRRAWQCFDSELNLWADATARKKMQLLGRSAPFLAKRIAAGCQAVLRENLDAWDYPWVFTRIAQSGLGVTPSVNLIANIGYGEDATHTTDPNSSYANIPVQPMQFPLRHNLDMSIDFEYYKQCQKAEPNGNTRAPFLLQLINNLLKVIINSLAGPSSLARWTIFTRHLWTWRRR